VLEACEFRGAFLKLEPRIAVVTNLEWDHVDYYPNETALHEAFAQFLQSVPEDGCRVVQWDAARRLGKDAVGETFAVIDSLQPNNLDEPNWLATPLASGGAETQFRLTRNGDLIGNFTLPLLGRHNIENAVAASLAAHRLGIGWDEIVAGLRSFSGLRRRLQKVNSADGVHHYDDFAHHPTAVGHVLATLRQAHPEARIIALFEPHQATRTRQLLDNFAAALAGVDSVGIMEVYRAREPADLDPAVADDLAACAAAGGTVLLPGRDWDQLWPAARAACREGDVLVTISAGHLRKDRYELD